MYLLPFVRDPSLLPFGADTRKYIARASILRAEGIAGLESDTSSIAERPTGSVLMATITGLTGTTPFTYAWLTPAIFASIIALAAGALATDGLGEPRRRALAYAVGVGCSAFVAWTAYGYAANLLVDPLIVALFLVGVLAATTGRGRLAGTVLLMGAALTHWVFAALAAGLLAIFAILLALGKRLHGPLRPRDGAARDVAAILVGGLAGAVVAFGFAPSLPGKIPEVSPETVIPRITHRLPDMRLPITGPVAALGFVLASLRTDAKRRWCLALLLLWASLVPLSLVGWYLFGLPTTPYRFAGFALAIPLMFVMAVACAGDLVRRRLGRIGAVVSVSALLAATLGLAATGAGVWWRAEPTLHPDKLAQLGTLASYLSAQPTDLEVLVPVPAGRLVPIDQLQVGLPPEMASRAHPVPVSTDPRYPDGGIDAPDGTAVVWLAAFAPRTPLSGTALGPGVVLVHGPPPVGPVTPGTSPRAPSPAAMILLMLAAIGALCAAGSGWSHLIDISWIGRASLMPSFGVATLGIAGLVLNRVGVPFDAWGSASILAVTTVAGWASVAVARRRPGDEGETPGYTSPTQPDERPETGRTSHAHPHPGR